MHQILLKAEVLKEFKKHRKTQSYKVQKNNIFKLFLFFFFKQVINYYLKLCLYLHAASGPGNCH